VSYARLATPVLVAAVLAAGGCGGSSKSTPTATTAASKSQPATTQTATTTQTTTATTPPIASTPGTPIKVATGKQLARADLISKGEAICARTNAELSSSTIKSEKDLIRLLPQTAIYDKTEATELSQLVPPAAMAQAWKRIVNGFQLFGEYTSRVAEYARAKNYSSGHPLVARAEKLHAEVADLAKRNGFNECGQI
jgi:hypothetical protein